MKISILTHPLGANYGGILQAFALSTYLREQGHEVFVFNRNVDMTLLKRVIKVIMVVLHHPRYSNPRYQHRYALLSGIYLILSRSIHLLK